MARDLEVGNAEAEDRRSIANNEKEVELDEYSNLVRYISTYRDTKGTAAAVEEQADYDEKKRPWYAFWRKEHGPGGAIDIPGDWLETDINTGLTTEEVERRRRKTGFNELADIKENMFLKFIGFFRGPVLYGTFSANRSPPFIRPRPAIGSAIGVWRVLNHVLTFFSLQLWKSLFSSRLVCVLGLISVSLSLFYYSTPLSDGTRRSRPPMSWPRSRVISL